LTLVLLAAVAVLEAVVYQNRYRATHGTPVAAGLWTFAVCVLRVAFVAMGVSAAMSGEHWLGVVLAYAVPAAIVTGLVRAREIKGAKR
jgi:uncharacterized protein (DUF983 family)